MYLSKILDEIQANLSIVKNDLILKSVQVMVRLHIFKIWQKVVISAEMTTFLPEMKISEKYASGP
jgi:hypothetical protein